MVRSWLLSLVVVVLPSNELWVLLLPLLSATPGVVVPSLDRDSSWVSLVLLISFGLFLFLPMVVSDGAGVVG